MTATTTHPPTGRVDAAREAAVLFELAARVSNVAQMVLDGRVEPDFDRLHFALVCESVLSDHDDDEIDDALPGFLRVLGRRVRTS